MLTTETEAFVNKAYQTLKSGAYHGASRKREAEDDHVELEDAEAPAKRQAYVEEHPNENIVEEMPDNPEGMPMSDGPIQARARKNTRPAVPKGWCRDYHSTYAFSPTDAYSDGLLLPR